MYISLYLKEKRKKGQLIQGRKCFTFIGTSVTEFEELSGEYLISVAERVAQVHSDVTATV